MHPRTLAAAAVIAALLTLTANAAQPERWSAERAWQWHAQTPWLVGCNYAPRTAINQLEMWQADTFDPKVIDEELGWAEGLGFNSLRVFLHHMPWQEDAAGFTRRIDEFLAIAEKHHIGVMFVLFDGVWDPFPKSGQQRAPRPHVHNSGWVQSPGAEILRDPARHDSMRNYVVGIVTRYRADPRVQVWDLFNEPDNPNPAYSQQELKNKAEAALQLLTKTFAWARSADPMQPLTAGVWRDDWADSDKLSPINRYMLEQSDVISFHTYDPIDRVRAKVATLQKYGRPLLCTEYMARGNGSRFDPQLAYFEQEKIGAYNWGFVSGKSQTIYPWDSWLKKYAAEPELWFHDIFRPDGTAYDEREVEFIKRQTGKQ